jgi:hypothetical protein
MLQEVRTSAAYFGYSLLIHTAYTIYAFFEWSLVLLDVAFDAVTVVEFENFEIVVKDLRGISRGYVHWLPK